MIDSAEKKETAGQIYQKLKNKYHESNEKIHVFELQEAMQADYIPKLVAQVDKDKLLTDGDLYIEVCTKRNPIMPEMIGNWFKSRITCPTPWYDQSVFRYDRKADKIVYLWTIPDVQICYELVQNQLLLSPDERALLKFVLDFKDGTLLQMAKKLNNEVNDYRLEFFRKDEDGNRITS